MHKVNGTTGEGILSLTVDERIRLAEAWIKEKEKVPTQIIQVGGCAFRDAQKLVIIIVFKVLANWAATPAFVRPSDNSGMKV